MKQNIKLDYSIFFILYSILFYFKVKNRMVLEIPYILSHELFYLHNFLAYKSFHVFILSKKILVVTTAKFKI